jgi:signal recognition particle receptor subunit beta
VGGSLTLLAAPRMGCGPCRPIPGTCSFALSPRARHQQRQNHTPSLDLALTEILPAEEEGVRQVTLVFVGLESSGKSSIVNNIKGKPSEFVTPTCGFELEEAKFDGYEVRVFLGGGHIPGYWAEHYDEVHGVVFVIDSSDRAHIPKWKQAFDDMASDGRVWGKPILLFANKQDRRGALTAEEISEVLGLAHIETSPVHIAPCVAKVELPREQTSVVSETSRLTAEEEKVTSSESRVPRTTPDLRILAGMSWLLDQIGFNYEQLTNRIATAKSLALDSQPDEHKQRVLRFRDSSEVSEQVLRSERNSLELQPREAVRIAWRHSRSTPSARNTPTPHTAPTPYTTAPPTITRDCNSSPPAPTAVPTTTPRKAKPRPPQSIPLRHHQNITPRSSKESDKQRDRLNSAQYPGPLFATSWHDYETHRHKDPRRDFELQRYRDLWSPMPPQAHRHPSTWTPADAYRHTTWMPKAIHKQQLVRSEAQKYGSISQVARERTVSSGNEVNSFLISQSTSAGSSTRQSPQDDDDDEDEDDDEEAGELQERLKRLFQGPTTQDNPRTLVNNGRPVTPMLPGGIPD